MTTAPDPTNPDLLGGLRTYLHEQGLVRKPRDGTDMTLPPMWVVPRNGTPAPGQTEGIDPVEVGQDLVVGVQKSTGIPSPPYEGFIRRDGVQFEVRARIPPIAYKFENDVRIALNDKRGWTMHDVPVNESLLYRDLQPIGSDNNGWVFTFEYMFTLWGPFTPVGP